MARLLYYSKSQDSANRSAGHQPKYGDWVPKKYNLLHKLTSPSSISGVSHPEWSRGNLQVVPKIRMGLEDFEPQIFGWSFPTSWAAPKHFSRKASRTAHEPRSMGVNSPHFSKRRSGTSGSSCRWTRRGPQSKSRPGMGFLWQKRPRLPWDLTMGHFWMFKDFCLHPRRMQQEKLCKSQRPQMPEWDGIPMDSWGMLQSRCFDCKGLVRCPWWHLTEISDV